MEEGILPMASVIFITGPGRSGTTLLLSLMTRFPACKVNTQREVHPLDIKTITDGMKEISTYKYYVIKQPYNTYFVPKYSYQQLISNGYKIISIIRDPRDILVSRHSANLKKYWLDVNNLKLAAIEHLKFANRHEVLEVKFESLITNTESIMDCIASFIGCEYSKPIGDFYKSFPAKTVLAKALNGIRPIDPNNIGNWNLPQNKDRTVEIMKDNELVEIIEKLGYK